MDDIIVGDPERRLSCLYAPVGHRRALQTLWALDAQLAGLIRAASDPMIGQMRFTWWHEALTRLDEHPPPAQPLLRSIADHVLPSGVAGAALAAMIDGWEVLLDAEPPGDAAILLHADARGARLFTAAATLLGASADDPVAAAGRLWAMIDLGVHLRDDEARARCFAAASPLARTLTGVRWSRAGRPIGMLAQLAIRDAKAGPAAERRQGSPARLLRMLQHRVTGR